MEPPTAQPADLLFPTGHVLVGDCLARLADLADNSVDSVVSDPPYGIEFMGKEWDTPKKFAGSVVEDPASQGGYQDKNGGNAYSNARIRYGLAPHTYQQWFTLVAAELYRVLKPGGHLLAFGGTRMYHRMTCAVEDAGFEIRDSIHWTYATGFPKSHNPFRDDDDPRRRGLGTALKPSHEPIVVARKPLAGTVAANVLEWGTGALNIDGCRVGAAGGTAGSNFAKTGLLGIGGKADIVPIAAGRWPANSVFTHAAGCEQVGTADETIERDFDKQAGNTFSVGSGTDGTRTGQWVSGQTTPVFSCAPGCPVAALDTQSGHSKSVKARRVPAGPVKDGVLHGVIRSDADGHNDAGGASRYFTQTTWSPVWDAPFLYVAKPSRRERNAGLDGLPERQAQKWNAGGISAHRAETAIPVANTHPTVKPVALMRHLVRLVTPPGGTVLDPFLGSGTTAVAAILEHFTWVGCEMTPDYLPIITGRVEHAQAEADPTQPQLFT